MLLYGKSMKDAEKELPILVMLIMVIISINLHEVPTF